MKKNGFIATSLIYSFFLLFCALLVSFISLYIHNKNLLNNVTDGIKESLGGEKTLGNVIKENGAYIKLDVCRNKTEMKSVKWIFLSKSNDANIEVMNFVSDSAIFYTTNYTTTADDLQKDFDTFRNLYLVKARYMKKDTDSNYESDFPSDLPNADSTTLTDLAKASLYSQLYCVQVAGDNNGYLYWNENDSKAYGMKCTNSDGSSSVLPVEKYKYNGTQITNLSGYYPNVATRAVITISSNTKIKGGNGTINNPYIISYYPTDDLIYYLDARNATGQFNITKNSQSIYDLSCHDDKALVGTYSSNNGFFELTGTNIITSSFDLATALKDKDGKLDDFTIQGTFTDQTNISFKLGSYLSFNYSMGTGNGLRNINVSGSAKSINYNGEKNEENNVPITIVKEKGTGSNNLKVYIGGGTPVYTTTLSSNPPASGLYLTLGGFGSGSYKTFRIYKGALSESDVNNSIEMDRWSQS